MVRFYPLKLYNVKPTPLPKTEDFEKKDLEKNNLIKMEEKNHYFEIIPDSRNDSMCKFRIYQVLDKDVIKNASKSDVISKVIISKPDTKKMKLIHEVKSMPVIDAIAALSDKSPEEVDAVLKYPVNARRLRAVKRERKRKEAAKKHESPSIKQKKRKFIHV